MAHVPSKPPRLSSRIQRIFSVLATWLTLWAGTLKTQRLPLACSGHEKSAFPAHSDWRKDEKRHSLLLDTLRQKAAALWNQGLLFPALQLTWSCNQWHFYRRRIIFNSDLCQLSTTWFFAPSAFLQCGSMKYTQTCNHLLSTKIWINIHFSCLT